MEIITDMSSTSKPSLNVTVCEFTIKASDWSSNSCTITFNSDNSDIYFLNSASSYISIASDSTTDQIEAFNNAQMYVSSMSINSITMVCKGTTPTVNITLVLYYNTTMTIISGDNNVSNTLATTTKAYITGTTSASTNTSTQIFDTGVYLDTTAGRLHSDSINTSLIYNEDNPLVIECNDNITLKTGNIIFTTNGNQYMEIGYNSINGGQITIGNTTVATKDYVADAIESLDDKYLPLSGGTLTGTLTVASTESDAVEISVGNGINLYSDEIIVEVSDVDSDGLLIKDGGDNRIKITEQSLTILSSPYTDNASSTKLTSNDITTNSVYIDDTLYTDYIESRTNNTEIYFKANLNSINMIKDVYDNSTNLKQVFNINYDDGSAWFTSVEIYDKDQDAFVDINNHTHNIFNLTVPITFKCEEVITSTENTAPDASSIYAAYIPDINISVNAFKKIIDSGEITDIENGKVPLSDITYKEMSNETSYVYDSSYVRSESNPHTIVIINTYNNLVKAVTISTYSGNSHTEETESAYTVSMSNFTDMFYWGGEISVSSSSSDSSLTYSADNNTTYSVATTSSDGLMSASDKSKLDAITASADAVSFTQSLTSGTAVGTITINGTDTILYAPTNTDTKVTNTLATTTKAYITGTSTATTNTGTQIFDTGVYLTATAGQLYVNSLQLGTGTVILSKDPTSEMQAATKQYVDNLISNILNKLSSSSTIWVFDKTTDITYSIGYTNWSGEGTGSTYIPNVSDITYDTFIDRLDTIGSISVANNLSLTSDDVEKVTLSSSTTTYYTYNNIEDSSVHFYVYVYNNIIKSISIYIPEYIEDNNGDEDSIEWDYSLYTSIIFGLS